MCTIILAFPAAWETPGCGNITIMAFPITIISEEFVLSDRKPSFLTGKPSFVTRQVLNLNRMNFLGSGVFSIPRK